MSKQGYVAFDLGAESGRSMLATLDGGRLSLQETHRFANLPLELPSGLHWNLMSLWADMADGLGRSAQLANQCGAELTSVGVDTWGVDYALLGRSGQLLSLPYCYRDPRHTTAYQQVLEKVTRQEIYDATGIQFMALNTLYQVYAQHTAEPGTLEQADRLVMVPDLLNYWFTGEVSNEATDISTTQMIDPRTGTWATGLLDKLGIPTHMLGPTTPAGSEVGVLRAQVAEQAGVGRLPVIAPGTHDTASAVAAVPVDAATAGNWAYISSGTWSLMGAELDEPVINDATCAASFTNEGGVGGTIRFLKNIAGLWLVQECRRAFAKAGDEYDYATLTQMAADAEPFRTLVNPDFAEFIQPGRMPEKIATFAEATGQPRPQSPGQFVRCCLESLAMAYRRTLNLLEELLDRRMDVLHVVGGGGQNHLLDQMTADAIGRPVIVGPYEATAIGNALVQAIGRGALKDLAELRSVVRASFDLLTFEPQNAPAFDAEFDRFTQLVKAR